MEPVKRHEKIEVFSELRDKYYNARHKDREATKQYQEKFDAAHEEYLKLKYGE